MAKFDPFRQGVPETPPPAPFPMPPGQVPPPGYPQAGFPQPGYAQPAYPQPAYGQPAFGQPYPAPQQPAYAPPPPAYPAPQPGYFPPQPAPVAYGQPQYPPAPAYPPSPYAPPPPAPAYPTAYAPAQPVPQPVPGPYQAPELPMSARAVPVQPAPVPVTVKPVMPKPVAVAPAAPMAPVAPAALATQPRPVQPVAPVNLAPTRPAPVQPTGVLPAGARPANKAGGAARPLPAPAKKGDEKPKVDAATDPDAPPPDPTEKMVKGAPPWMVSMVVHMVLLIILALISIPMLMKNQIEIVVEQVYAEKLGEQIIDDQLQSPESLNIEIENPALSFDLKPVEDPLAAPPIIDPALVSPDANVSVSDIVAPSIGMALTGREAGAKKALLGAYGGNATTEAAVREGLLWLKKNQQADGGWSLTGPFSTGSSVDNKVSATAMALLAFQGAGHTHKTGEFKDTVAKGWKALKAMQNPDGMFICDCPHHHRLYAQAQATIAACELYGMTKDETYRPVAQKAIDFAIAAQDPYLGGWRYEPKQDSDTSVTGWFVMALQSGMMAGLEVASPNVEQVNKFLDQVQSNGGSHYMYKPGMETTLTMTAEGLLCRQYLGWKDDDERMIRGLDYVCANTINYNDANVYYWYYATQAAHHMGGHHWKQWNQVMIQTVPQAQTKTGAEKGSWDPSGDRWGTHGGRLYVTCLHIYMLEAYYRHLPLYKHRIEMPKGVMEGAGKALTEASK